MGLCITFKVNAARRRSLRHSNRERPLSLIAYVRYMRVSAREFHGNT